LVIFCIFIENFAFESEFLGIEGCHEMGAILGGVVQKPFYRKIEPDFIYRKGIFLKILAVGISTRRHFFSGHVVERGARL